MQLVINLSSTFMLGLLTPLTAVCVLPLSTGFLSFLSRKLSTKEGNRGRPMALGGLVTSGVILFMLLVGLVFTTLIEASLTRVIQVVSPIAFAALAVISVLLIFNVDAGKLFPQARIPSVKNAYLSALLYGFFFGSLVVPCNPGMIAAFFTKTLATTTAHFLVNMLHFLLFALGIGFPLLVIALVSGTASQTIVRFLVTHKAVINRVAGAIMLGISLYYLVFVFGYSTTRT
ncbi:MAG: cytochrome C biogenesis protein [Spirochaetia bacterium]